MWWRRKPDPKPEQPYLERLEPRILYSADFGAALLGASAPQQEEQRLLDSSGDYVASAASDASSSTSLSAPEVTQALAHLPLAFEANVGQTDNAVDFFARGSGYRVFLTEGDAVIDLSDGDSGYVVRLDLVGANEAPVAGGENATNARSNYLTGDDTSRWQTNIANYMKVRYAGVYEGIDLVYYGNQQQLEYDFHVAAGADASQIRLQFDGADRALIDTNGDLVLSLGDNEIRFRAPVSYQDGAEGRELVESRYVLQADGTIGFSLGNYDPGRALVIDPVLSYFTYLTGSLNEEVANGVAVDGAGSVYVVGQTKSTDFPITAGAYKSAIAPSHFDAYVTKFDPTLSSLVYSTYLGGTAGSASTTLANAIAVDSAGNAWITGWTKDATFPTFNSPLQSSLSGSQDAFVTKLNSTGTALLYSTFLGGDQAAIDEGRGIAIDASDNAYVVGATAGSGFPTTLGVIGGVLNGEAAFLTKFSSSGAVVYSTLLGGSGDDVAQAVAVDGFGNAYVAGWTSTASSLLFTGGVVPGYDTTYDGGSGSTKSDAFVAKLNSAGTSYLYFTFLGGSGNDDACAIAVDSAGTAYVVGNTASTAFPTTANAYDTVQNGGDGFLTILDATGTSLVYSSYFGGDGADAATGVGVDSAGRVYIAGYTDNGSGFPAATQTVAGTTDIFVGQLNPGGAGTSDLLYLDFHGGAGSDEVYGAVLKDGKLYLAGSTTSSSLATAGAYQSAYPAGDPQSGFAAVYTFTAAPVLANPSAVSYTENDSALTINTSLTVSDADSATLSNGTVTIPNFVSGEDVLSFMNDGSTMGNIAGSFDSASGILSLTSAGATATLAQWQAALRMVRYSNSSENPNATTRSVTYSLSDGSSDSNPLTSTVAITAVNDAPFSTNDAASTAEDTPLVLSLADFGTYTDVEGSALASVQITNLPASGNVEFDNAGTWQAVGTNQVVSSADIAAGKLRFTAPADANGAAYATIGFKVGDGALFSAAVYTLSIDVAAVNDAPTTTNDAVTTTEDQRIILSLSDFGTYADADGNALSAVQITSLPTGGGLALDNNGVGSVVTLNQIISAADILAGRLRFTPDSDQSGTPYTTVGFKVGDGTTFSAAAYTLTISVLDVNDAPASTNDLVVTNEDTPVVLAASDFGSYSDVEGSPLAAVRITLLPASGSLEYDNAGSWQAVGVNQVISAADLAAGRLRFVPAANANGAGYATIGYKPSDGADFSVAAYTLTIEVTPVNDAPTAVADTLVATEDTATTFTAAQLVGNDIDVEGDSLTIASVTGISGGTVLLNADGTVSFTPNADFNGAASFSYTVTDGSATSSASTVTVNVASVNDTPVGVNDLLSASEDTSITYTAAQLLGNDNDIDGDSLRIASVTSGAGGAVVLNADGTVSFTPDPNFNGAASFGYTVTDGVAISAATTVSVNVAAVNDAPVAAADTLAAAEDTPVTYTAAQLLGNDTDVDGDTVRIASVTSGAGGTAVLNANGTVTFTPRADFNGTAGFSYTVADASATSAAAAVTVNVASVNDTPVPVSDTLSAIEDTADTYSAAQLLDNDTDIDGDTLSIASVTSGTGGSVVLNADGTVSFTPDANFNGAANFTYTITDGIATSTASSVVVVNVAAVDDAPVSTNDSLVTVAGTIYVLRVSDFGVYSDVEGAALAAVQITALPIGALLEYDNAGSWQPVAPGQIVTAASLAGGKLRVITDGNASGSDYARLGFTVSDGTLWSTGSYALSLDVLTTGPVVVAPLPTVPPPSPVPNESTAPAPSAPAQSSALAIATAPSTDALLVNPHTAPMGASMGTALLQEGLVTLRATDTVMAPQPVSLMRFNLREISIGAQAGDEGTLDAVWLTSSQVSAPQIFLLNDATGSSKRSPFMDGIDRLREAHRDEDRLEHMVSAAAAVAGLSFSVGYVIWLVRGGILATSLLSALPAWRMLDPLPVLSRIGDDEEEPDEDALRPEHEVPMFEAGWAR